MTTPVTTPVTTGTPNASQQDLDSPAFECAAYAAMKDDWLLCRDMMEGTSALRRRASTYLPREEAESAGDHAARVAKTELYPMFKRSITGLTGIVFRVDPQLAPDLDETFREEHWPNIDGRGTHGVVFGRHAFEDGLQVGHVGVLVDVPPGPKPIADGAIVTTRDEQNAGIRPYWIKISVEDLLSWRSAVIRGRTQLTQLVYRERTMQPLGEFMEYERTRFYVYKLMPDVANDENNTVSFQVWEQTVDTIALATGVPSNQPAHITRIGGTEILVNANAIPLSPCYTGQYLGMLQSRPPLVDLAHTNVAHAQVLSDHRHSLHKASVPIFVMWGRSANSRGLPLGPNTGLDLPPKTEGADADYVEHQGSALGATDRELTKIETRGGAQGLAMLQPDQRSAETAAANQLDREENTASLSSAARSLEDCYKQAIRFHCRYMKVEIPKDSVIITVNKDFTSAVLDVAVISALSTAVTAGQLPVEVFWEVLRNGGIIPEDTTDEQMMELLLKLGVQPAVGGAADPSGIDNGNPATGADGVPPADASGAPPTNAGAAP